MRRAAARARSSTAVRGAGGTRSPLDGAEQRKPPDDEAQVGHSARGQALGAGLRFVMARNHHDGYLQALAC
jgi:hypothetical protein